MGTRGRYEEKLPRIVLIFENENPLRRRVDCNDQNFHELMIFLYIRNLKFVLCVYVQFYENYEC